MSFVDKIVSRGRQLIGTPYVKDGRDTEKGIDCTGLIIEMFKAAGISLPSDPIMWRGRFKPIPRESSVAGDMVLIEVNNPRSGNEEVHLAIATSPRKVIHSVNTAVGVVETRYPFPGWKVKEYYRYIND